MILRRYVSQQVATTTAIVLFFLMTLMLGGRLIRYFGIAAEGRLDVGLLFLIIGYNLPAFLELILPLSFFVALMLVFGRMYVDNEMSIINSSGISRGQLATMITPLILGLFILQFVLTLWIKPWGVLQTEQVWQRQALTSALDLIKPRTFINSQNYHLYVGSFDKKQRALQDVYLIQRNLNDGKDMIVMAKSAKQVQTSEDDPMTQLDLFEGRRYEIGTNSQVYNQVSFESYRISLAKPPSETLEEARIETVTTKKLLENSTAPMVQAELGYRFSLPFLIIIAVMLAVPLAQVQPRQGRWLRLLPAILIFVSCAISIISLKTAITKQKVTVFAYAWVVLGFMIFALYLNWQGWFKQRIRYRSQSQHRGQA